MAFPNRQSHLQSGVIQRTLSGKLKFPEKDLALQSFGKTKSLLFLLFLQAPQLPVVSAAANSLAQVAEEGQEEEAVNRVAVAEAVEVDEGAEARCPIWISNCFVSTVLRANFFGSARQPTLLLTKPRTRQMDLPLQAHALTVKTSMYTLAREGCIATR